jgi:hypothetical protein
MPVGEMLRRMDSAEITEWIAFYDLRANPPKKAQTPEEIRATLSQMMHLKRRKRSG